MRWLVSLAALAGIVWVLRRNLAVDPPSVSVLSERAERALDDVIAGIERDLNNFQQLSWDAVLSSVRAMTGDERQAWIARLRGLSLRFPVLRADVEKSFGAGESIG